LNFLAAALIAFYLGVLLGFDSMIALGGALCAALARVIFALLILEDDYDDGR